MKVCVCSDSHGNWMALQEMVDREKPRIILFLGDGERDWSHVDLPQHTSFYAVCGNCDWMAMEPPMRRLELCGKTIFLTHGHLYGAKNGLSGLERYVRDLPTDLVLYGHTHHPQMDRDEHTIYLCPGSMNHQEERYAVLTLAQDQPVDVSFRRL